MKTFLISQYWRPILEAFADVMEPSVMRLTGGTRLVAVETPESDLAFHRVSRRGTAFLGHGADLDEGTAQTFRKARRPVVELRLASQHLVSDRLKIPAEASTFAAQIVESRLDRLTPWPPSRLLYGFAASAKPDADGQVEIDFVATSRDISKTAIERLHTFGLVPSRIGSAAEPLEKPLRIDLLQGENDAARSSRRRMIVLAACAAVTLSLACFAASAYGVWLTGQQAAQASADQAKARQEMMAGAGGSGERDRQTAILGEKSPAGARFLLIDRLATIIPDGTFLDQLDIQPGSVRIAGFSTEASSLIAILESEPGFADATFSAPVTRQDDGRDRFDILVLHSPAGKEATP